MTSEAPQRGALECDDTLQRLDAAMSPPGGLSFSTLQQPLRGTPMLGGDRVDGAKKTGWGMVRIREGNLWYLSAEDQVDAVEALEKMSLLLRVEVSISLSPFVLVRNCKFQSGYNATLTDVKIFKISLFAHSACYYFGVRSEDERWAEEERSRWVLDVSRAIRLVTQSLFPPFRITCEPLQGAPQTRRRLMAGYVVYHEDVSTASVVYFELQAHEKGMAKMLLYENSKCQVVVGEIPLHESAMCSEKIGINCSCFSVEDGRFVALRGSLWSFVELWKISMLLQSYGKPPFVLFMNRLLNVLALLANLQVHHSVAFGLQYLTSPYSAL
eukprot:s27_g43.t1